MTETSLRDASAYAVWTTDTIRYVDLDPNGHVNNGAINAFFEDGRVRLREEHLALPGETVLSGFVVAKLTIEYLAALHFPGEVRIGTVVVAVGNSSYTLGQGLFRDGRCVATAEVVTVHVDPRSGRSAPLPDAYKEQLRALSAPGA